MAGIDDRDYHKSAGVPSTGRPSIYELRQPEFDLGEFLDEHLPGLRGGRVLDAGSGPGAYVADARARAGELVTLDIAFGPTACFTHLPIASAPSGRCRT